MTKIDELYQEYLEECRWGGYPPSDEDFWEAVPYMAGEK